jgi:bifunctional non-homologous end joining protein LigD
VVNFAYGRRGSTLQTGTKTPAPVDHDTAKRTFDKLVREKTAKGYTPGPDGTPYSGTAAEPRSTSVLPQLLNAITESEAEPLMSDPAWWAQEKFDGKRILIRRSDDRIVASNRRGLVVAVPEPIEAYARRLGCQQWVIDGEAIGDTFYAFDLLEWACNDHRALPYSKRLRTLDNLLSIVAGNGNSSALAAIRGVETATTWRAKKALMARLREQHKEGVVFKRHDASYTPGRPASGGPQLKLKFTATASCIVAGSNGTRRSVKLELLDPAGNRVGVGNVTVPANQPIPTTGGIVEVRYLYAYPNGSLFQPVLVGVRDDLDVSACVTRQLKLKAGGGDDGEDI